MSKVIKGTRQNWRLGTNDLAEPRPRKFLGDKFSHDLQRLESQMRAVCFDGLLRSIYFQDDFGVFKSKECSLSSRISSAIFHVKRFERKALMLAFFVSSILLMVMFLTDHVQGNTLHGSTHNTSWSDQPTTNLLDLPLDIIVLIIREIVGGAHQDVDITVPPNTSHHIYARRWREDLPAIFHCFRLKNLMSCSKRAKEVVLASFEMYRTFYSDNTEGLRRLPKLLNPSCFSYIRKLSMKMDDFAKNNDELVFPGVLNVLCKHLKHLKELKLFSETERATLQTPSTDHRDKKFRAKISRQQQETRTLTRFMAHVVVRHDLLKRLILPTGSGVMPELQNGNCVIKHFLLADAGQARSWDSEDKVLNATDLCLKPWSELALVDLSDFTISPPLGESNHEIFSSRVALKNGYYAPVFEQAYSVQPNGKWKSCEDEGVDDMITKCGAIEAKAHQEVEALLASYMKMCSIDVQAKIACSECDYASNKSVGSQSAAQKQWWKKRRVVVRKVPQQSQIPSFRAFYRWHSTVDIHDHTFELSYMLLSLL